MAAPSIARTRPRYSEPDCRPVKGRNGRPITRPNCTFLDHDLLASSNTSGISGAFERFGILSLLAKNSSAGLLTMSGT